MNDEVKMHTIFSIMKDVGWIAEEKYRNGTLALLSECSTPEEFGVIEFMLSNLRYCKSSDVSAVAHEAAEFISQRGLTHHNSILVGLAEGSKTCGSSAIVRAIEVVLPHNWSSVIYTTFVSAFRKRDGKQNLIIVDDFVGTGDKISAKVDSLRNNPKTADYNIYLITFAGMKQGLDRLQGLVEDVFCGINLDKLITCGLQEPNLSTSLAAMNSLEDKLFNDPNSEYRLGYKASEAAFYLEAANIPNNTFPVLWWDKYNDGRTRYSLFPRR